MSLVPQSLFPFPLDEFQVEAMETIAAGENLLVSAPTGSGKTAIAEYAIELALHQNRRLFYTTPLKALSNQKLRDFGKKWGEENVGLLTGDITLNRDARIVVMTTEVYRNMLYGTSLGSVEENTHDVGWVVLDEVHFMNDEERGTVWEESIIYSPPNLRLIALSATVANARDLAAWMAEVHGPTHLVTSDFRPVPLRFHYFDGRNLTALLKRNTGAQHRPRLDRQTGRRLKTHELRAEPRDLAAELHAHDLLPAIYFVFSRKGCEEAMYDCAGLKLVTDAEADEIARQAEEYIGEYPHLQGHEHLTYLERGMAVHHAGLLPAWKVLVEKLFQAGLIRVVFATETLAAGINMPARSTILSTISKRSDYGIRVLTASEFLQMSGRAGRRGMDRLGHVTVVGTPHHTQEEAQDLATAPPDPLGSNFTPTYSMVLNLLQRHTLEEAEFLISRSFGAYLDARQSRRKILVRKKRSRSEPPAPVVYHSTHNWSRFLQLRAMLTEYGYLNQDHPTPPGVTASAIRAEHELRVAEAIRLGLLVASNPADTAAVAAALVAEEMRPRMWVKRRPSGPACGKLSKLMALARKLREDERAIGLYRQGRVHTDTAGLVQHWAAGAEWPELLRWTNLAEGDVVRIIRRSLDLLEQIARAPMIAEETRISCLNAAAALNRDPVSEIV